jgi:hypothetical protein
MMSHLRLRVLVAGVCAASLFARSARADDGSPAPPARPEYAADAPANDGAQAPRDDAGPSVGFTAEAGGGQSRPSPSSSPSTFLYQRAVGRYAATRTLDLSATLRATEDLASPKVAGAKYATGGDGIFYGAIDGVLALSPHVDLSLGLNGSPTSTRDLATTLHLGAPGPGRDVDALVRARTSSFGAVAELGYDTFDADVSRSVDAAFEASAALTHFATTQSVVEASGRAPAIPSTSAGLVQGRLGATTTVTLAEHTDVGVDAAYFVYDAPNPGNIGLFDVTSGGQTTSFGAGIPMLPPRWTVRPEVGQRIGILTLRAYYQYADLAVDNAVGHTVGGKVQVGLGRVKVYATGSYRTDVFADSTAQTFVAGLGVTGRF